MVMDLAVLRAEEERKSGMDSYLDECISTIAIMKGDQQASEALSNLYGKTSTAVFGYALSFLKNRQDAEDVLHDCYVQIYQSADQYRSNNKPMAWILTIARNLCMQKFRRDSKVVDLPTDDWEFYLESKEGMSVEEKLLVKQCMSGLPTEDLQIIILHAVCGYKMKEISEMMGIPLSTVLSKHARSIKKLKQSLEEESRYE